MHRGLERSNSPCTTTLASFFTLNTTSAMSEHSTVIQKQKEDFNLAWCQSTLELYDGNDGDLMQTWRMERRPDSQHWSGENPSQQTRVMSERANGRGIVQRSNRTKSIAYMFYILWFNTCITVQHDDRKSFCLVHRSPCSLPRSKCLRLFLLVHGIDFSKRFDWHIVK